MTTDQAAEAEADLRRRAEKRLNARRDLGAHVLVYVFVNAVLVIIWWVQTRGYSFFWPVFPIGIWGFALGLKAWDVLTPEPTEADIVAEMARLRGH